jgi:hypothetical protein
MSRDDKEVVFMFGLMMVMAIILISSYVSAGV